MAAGAPWHLTSLAKVMIGKQRRRGGRGRMREGEDGNNRGGRQQPCLSSSNQVAIRKHKKAHTKHNNQPPKQRRRSQLVAGKGAGLVRNEATRVERQARKRGGRGDERHRQCRRSGSKNNDDGHGLDQEGCHSSGEHERDDCRLRFDY
jgi:hypothetical protein